MNKECYLCTFKRGVEGRNMTNLTTGQDIVDAIKSHLVRLNADPLDIGLAFSGPSIDFTLLEVFDNQESTVVDIDMCRSLWLAMGAGKKSVNLRWFT